VHLDQEKKNSASKGFYRKKVEKKRKKVANLEKNQKRGPVRKETKGRMSRSSRLGKKGKNQ